jgi:serine/threonine protein kinase
MQCSGYQPPEYIDRREISKMFDIFSLGVVMIQIVSGSKGYDHNVHFIDLVSVFFPLARSKEKEFNLILSHIFTIE